MITSTSLIQKWVYMLFCHFSILQTTFDENRNIDENFIASFQEIRTIVLNLISLDEMEQKETLDLLLPWQSYFRKTFQKAEYEYEKYVYNSIMEGTISQNEYISLLYRKMVDYELKMMNLYSNNQLERKMLFVGCGPMPFSAIYLALQDKKLQIDILDKEAEASLMASRIIHKLKLNDRIYILPPAKIEDINDLSNYTVIDIAAMVGEDVNEKKEIYRKLGLHLPPKKLLFTRSASPTTFSTLLYSPFPFDEVSDFYRSKKFEKIDRDVIVSGVLLERT